MPASHIITETVPTVVGMGVVSSTTKRMFGGRGGRKAKGRVSKVDTRKFNGKVYRLANTHTTKRVAEKDAEYFRKAGHSARVVKVGGRWAVYVR